MVPLTLITGSLGVGKTSAILDLARHKPAGERWVVLVNELGEVGIDGALLDDATGLEVAELPGGCLCCAARGPLLGKVRAVLDSLAPTRIIVEPSGVADPGRVIDDLAVLGQDIELRATIALIDPRALHHSVRRPPTWQAQVDAASVLVANKVDLCDGPEVTAFLRWGAERFPAPTVVATTVGGTLDPAWLDLPGKWTPPDAHRHVHGEGAQLHPVWVDATELLPAHLAGDLFRRAWSGPHHETCGWRFAPGLRFNLSRLRSWFEQVAHRDCPWLRGGALRVKGVLHTDVGWRAIQADLDGVRVRHAAWRTDSRVEIIGPAHSDNDWPAIDAQLLGCRSEQSP